MVQRHYQLRHQYKEQKVVLVPVQPITLVAVAVVPLLQEVRRTVGQDIYVASSELQPITLVAVAVEETSPVDLVEQEAAVPGRLVQESQVLGQTN
jgi:hypothetical protein